VSGITPILDTLLHQVLGRRVDTPVVKDQPLPVSAATSKDGIQPARSDSRLHQQGGERVAATSSGAGRDGVSQLPVAASGQSTVSSAQLHLSHAATDIANILSRFPAAQTTSIRPLISLQVQPGGGADSLATALSQSVRESGVFYESHLLRWMSGQYPRASLMREPQAWLSLTFRPFTPTSLLANFSFPLGIDSRTTPRQSGSSGAAAGSSTMGAASASTASRAGPVAPLPSAADRLLSSAAAGDVAGARSDPVMGASEERPSLSMTRAHQLAQLSSDTLQSLVRHQLELIAAPNLRWEGQLWPGVPMTLILTELPRDSVHDDNAEEASDRSQRESEGNASDWRAEVQVRLPSLGAIDIVFVARRNTALQVELKATEETARVQLRQELTPLRERLASLGMSVELALGAPGDE